ncbi:EscU/YscU/HrcU family type III secretion system export apparatus switch protein [Alteromonas oceanisediminis]|uniref:EscU/YscU/HrcU family type III secretion system export apparatus switch protein n=1 Tax=Alteromonas oceanisediminis TaxID=2836180 RepID=UPI001BDB304E|nr:EscU/YscU/HrcU family type III secretion system export apparatus switch protein [Alteromonas oceanisediminis]MBT0585079.1 EscU/YscU/HrcU family type III secretion system export apparatus switch protein [Alteromonas oceanisediminis]
MKKNVRKAVGLRYEKQQKGDAPTVVAKGFGELADDIIALAQEHGILIHEDPYLSDFLATLDLGQEIPESVYYVIAELIAFSYVLQGKKPEGWEPPGGGVDTRS